MLMRLATEFTFTPIARFVAHIFVCFTTVCPKYWTPIHRINGHYGSSFDLHDTRALTKLNFIFTDPNKIELTKEVAFVFVTIFAQARNQLGTPGGAKTFLRGAHIY